MRRYKILIVGCVFCMLASAVWYFSARSGSDIAGQGEAPSPAAPSVATGSLNNAAVALPGAAAPAGPAGPVPSTVIATPVPAVVVSPSSAQIVSSLPADLQSAGEVEVQAARRMYMAHASLREPSVADPDSEANRRILQSMVQKALQPAAIEIHQ